MARVFELADDEIPSTLFMPLLPLKDPDLQVDFQDHTKYLLIHANKTARVAPHDFTKSK
jgi:hypothetical protein